MKYIRVIAEALEGQVDEGILKTLALDTLQKTKHVQ
jgi:hypothetical protein